VRALRTPEDRFSNLEGWPYEPRYVEVGEHGLRMHYIDEGPPDAQPVLLAHGEPTWGYLYRKMIPPLLEAGARVVWRHSGGKRMHDDLVATRLAHNPR
jgi:haloalkane dehalogenase